MLWFEAPLEIFEDNELRNQLFGEKNIAYLNVPAADTGFQSKRQFNTPVYTVSVVHTC